MSLIEDIKSLEPHQVAVGIGSFLATVAPGFIVLLIFAPALVKDLDVLKLTLISSGITMPLIISNLFITLLASGSKDASDLWSSLLVAAGFSACVLYIPLIICLFARISLKEFVITGAIIELIGCLIALRDFFKSRPKQKT